MIIRGPNARRDFHVDPSDEIFYMLKGDMVLEYMQEGRRASQIIREGGLLLVPAFTPHAPHRPADTWGLVVEVKRQPGQTESLVWFCAQCDAKLHEVTMHVGDIEKDLKAAIECFDASLELRTCGRCGQTSTPTSTTSVCSTSRRRSTRSRYSGARAGRRSSTRPTRASHAIPSR